MQEPAPIETIPNTVDLEYLLYKIYYFFTDFFGGRSFDLVLLPDYIAAFMLKIQWLLLIAFAFFAIVTTYSKIRLTQIRQAERIKYNPPVEPAYDLTANKAPDASLSKRWDRVLMLVDSPHENDWRVAVIEADIIFGDILHKMGYVGDSIGDILKGIEPSDFLTLNQAWEAHKIRNEIAHNPNYKLTQREAKRAIELFREVFQEFYYI